ncbi:DNA-formamidopyrimidine glycosylase family protein [Luteimicrobium subarcticum]|uniref:DNA-(apurinic or apyrimidinic site) lyase n=1 Tax=Luteimicrobium subarcticum TaxID=620910 RepID=A0A2M8WTV9_9MICO|nr:DNA-formamidopyrimidine glycosylase family protein [Luteimicrobium subarcticum]PJI94383.1 endonuclease-8 [Luteimicrobium subarcticum]
MPEGDVVLLTARRLHAALAGRPLVRAELRWPTVAEAGLAGCTVREVVAYGKHLLVRLDDGRTLHTHLRMDGYWRIARTGTPEARGASPGVRAALANDLWTCLGHRLGMLDVVATRDEHRLLSHLGPDLLADDFPDRVDEAVGRLVAADAVGGFHHERPPAVGLPVGDALLSQQGVAGIGTIYASESLAAERVHPWAAVRDLGLPSGGARDAVLRRVLLTARRLEQEALVARGGPADVPRAVYGREGRPCRRCGTAVLRGVVNLPPYERQLYWCPACQPGPGPQPTGARSSGAR